MVLPEIDTSLKSDEYSDNPYYTSMLSFLIGQTIVLITRLFMCIIEFRISFLDKLDGMAFVDEEIAARKRAASDVSVMV